MTLIKVKVVPKSSRNAIDLDHEPIRIMLTSPPEKGKANKELLKFLQGLLGRKVRIVRGASAREKLIEVEGDVDVIQELRNARKAGKGKANLR